MPIFPADRRSGADIVVVPSATTSAALYVESQGADYGIQVDGKLRINGMQEDVQTTIEQIQGRLDKLERFYTQVVSEAQEVVDADDYAQNTDEWKERVFRIAEEVGLKTTDTAAPEMSDDERDK